MTKTVGGLAGAQKSSRESGTATPKLMGGRGCGVPSASGAPSKKTLENSADEPDQGRTIRENAEGMTGSAFTPQAGTGHGFKKSTRKKLRTGMPTTGCGKRGRRNCPCRKKAPGAGESLVFQG